MSSVKEQVISLVETLPEDCTLEDIQYHLYVCEKVQRGIRAVDEGRVIAQTEAEQRVREWLKSSGPNPRSTI